MYTYLPIDSFIDRGAARKESWKREAQLARYSTSKDWPGACIGSRYGSINVTMHPSHKYAHRHTGYS